MKVKCTAIIELSWLIWIILVTYITYITNHWSLIDLYRTILHISAKIVHAVFLIKANNKSYLKEYLFWIEWQRLQFVNGTINLQRLFEYVTYHQCYVISYFVSLYFKNQGWLFTTLTYFTSNKGQNVKQIAIIINSLACLNIFVTYVINQWSLLDSNGNILRALFLKTLEKVYKICDLDILLVV